MDKPISMSVKDFLVRTLAVKIMVSEKTIEAVVNHQFQTANEAMDINNSIEIAGFGKFFYNNKKAQKRIESLQEKVEVYRKVLDTPGLSEQKKHAAIVTLEKAEAIIVSLKSRTIYED